LGPFLVRFFVRRMRACTVVSHRTYDKLRSFFKESEWQRIAPRVAVLPMGVHATTEPVSGAEGANALRVQHGLVGKQIILFLGRLSEKKGIPFLIEAFSQVHNKNHDAILVIAGDGELRGEIEARIQQNDVVNSIVMPGYVTGDTKRAWLTAADVFAVPSIITGGGDAEGLPVALLEGLAAGKVCVATDESGADDVIEPGTGGFLVRAKDVSELASAIYKALSLSEEEACRIGERAREQALKYDWPVVARAHYEHLFAELREHNASGGRSL